MWLGYALATVALTCTLGLLFRIVALDSKNPRTFSFLFNAIILLITALLIPFFGVGTISLDARIVILMILSGAGYGIFQRYQFSIRQHIEASVMQLIVTPTSIVGFALAVLFLGETITPLRILGYSLIIASAMLVIKRKGMKLKFSRYVVGALIIGSALSIGLTLSRAVAPSFSSVLVYTLFIAFAQTMACFLPIVKLKDIQIEAKIHTWKLPFLAVVNLGALFCTIAAIRLAPATKVIPVTASNVVLMTLLGIILLKERDRVWIKLFAAALTMVGLVLVSR